uniref:small monomeric GTPase n=1 Tax=Monopterus albus TaxID=43700 RepID=A0A3Q3JS97_MONAL
HGAVGLQTSHKHFLLRFGTSALLKVILLGDGGVGKSSLMNCYVTNKFDSHLFHTIGVEFLNKELELDGRRVTLQIWDTAGQERFRSLRTPFYRGSDCCLLTFSVDDGQSFHNLASWKKEFSYYADVRDPDSFPFVVLGNKQDVPERQVSAEDARQWCCENGGHPYFETSAKDATNVASAFEEAVRRILALDNNADHLIHTNTVDLQRKSQRDSTCC